MQRQRFLSGDWSVFKVTREQKRNKYADEVCREVRHQLANHGELLDTMKVYKIIQKWMRYAKESKYIRP